MKKGEGKAISHMLVEGRSKEAYAIGECLPRFKGCARRGGKTEGFSAVLNRTRVGLREARGHLSGRR